MSEFGGLWKHENNQLALLPPKTECGCPSGGGIKNSYMEGHRQEKKSDIRRHIVHYECKSWVFADFMAAQCLFPAAALFVFVDALAHGQSFLYNFRKHCFLLFLVAPSAEAPAFAFQFKDMFQKWRFVEKKKKKKKKI